MQTLFVLFAQTMPGMPPECGWLAPAVLLMLGAAAAIDARTARVPDPLILGGILITTGVEGFAVDWSYAGQHLAMGFATGFLLYLINELYCRFMKRDAFGMGDAKWSVLTVSCFGPMTTFFAWVIGSWLALGWIGVMRLNKRKITRVHFAPFLFVGLCAGIYWLRLR